jgi:membrane associated rhomboid family serine protease
MIIPLRTDHVVRRRPVITETLILLNVLIFLAGMAGPYFGWYGADALARAGSFKPYDFHWWGLISYQFLHGGFLHILFNMLFLWVFGEAVEDRIGRIGFLGFYLIGGAMAGIAHGQVSPNSPVIGASGSVAAVTGAFLALFPRSRTRILLVFFIIGIYHIPSLWLIGLYFAIDVVNQLMDLFSPAEAGIAYMAHIAGYLYGFLVAFVLLAFRIIKRQNMDVFYLLSQARRRAEFRAANQQVQGGLWDAPARGGVEPPARHAAPRELSTGEQEDAAERSEISRLIGNHDLAGAAARYRVLLSRNPNAILTEERQLDVANQLAADGDHRSAARAYELLLSAYPRSPKADEVRLMLGLLCVRHLGDRERGTELLTRARPGLRDDRHTALADRLLAEATAR